MVKGVNRTVIEVNNTGSKMFEKIVLYVAPEYGAVNAARLKRAADELICDLEGQSARGKPRRRAHGKRRIRRSVIIAAAILTVAAAVFVVLCK